MLAGQVTGLTEPKRFAMLLCMATTKRPAETLPRGMRWLSCGFVWQVYDKKRYCRGAWSKEAPARAMFAKLGKGAEIFKCEDFGGYPPQFMGYMKRVALSCEVKA